MRIIAPPVATVATRARRKIQSWRAAPRANKNKKNDLLRYQVSRPLLPKGGVMSQGGFKVW